MVQLPAAVRPGFVDDDTGEARLWVTLWRAIAIVAVLAGVTWRVAQYVAGASLSVDEIAVARNILDRDVWGLFHRLEYGQVAPIAFLLAVKTCAVLFGSSEWSLRFVPFAAGIVTLPAFFLVSRRLVNETAACAATALVALATPLALWSVALKQYSSDVLCAIVIIGVCNWLRTRTLSRRDVVCASATGIVVAVWSHAALLVLAAAGAALILDSLLSRNRDLQRRGVIVGLWAAAVIPVAAWTWMLERPVDIKYMRKFWAAYFMPLHPLQAVNWWWDRMIAVFLQAPWPNGALGYARPKAWVALFVCGSVVFAWQRPRQALLIAAPFVLTLAASAMRQYPFLGRVGLFLIPFVLLLVVVGAQRIGSLAGRSAGMLAPFVVLPFATVAMLDVRPPYAPEHMRPELEYVSARLQTGDVIWVYYGAAQAFQYYSRRIPLRATVIYGDCDRTDPRMNLRQLDAVRGRQRAWIVVTHIVGAERQDLLRYLDGVGTLKDKHSSSPREFAATTSSVYLYRLDDRARLGQLSAETFVPTPIDEPSPWSCYGTMTTTAGSDRAAIRAIEQWK
jgi:hypothetical protein